jgi:hypothetical protein
VTFATSGLVAGTYNEIITVTAAGANSSPQVIPITLVRAGSTGLVAAFGLDEGVGAIAGDFSGNANRALSSAEIQQHVSAPIP